MCTWIDRSKVTISSSAIVTTLNNSGCDSSVRIEYCRCVDVTGAYSAQKTELNISLTAIGLLWTTTDFIAKGLIPGPVEERETG